MKLLAASLALVWLAAAHSAPDVQAIGRACHEKHRSSGSFDEIQACIDKALAEGKVPPGSPSAAVNSPNSPKASPPSSKLSEPEQKPTAAANSASEFQALDPDASYAGKGCTYFTKQSVGAVDWDGNRLMGTGLYVDGSEVAYGKWLYRCVAKRWKS